MFRSKALLLGLFCCSVLASPALAGYEEAPADSHREARWLLPMDGPLGSPFGPRWLDDYSGYGLVVKIRHARGIVTMYAHLSRAFVKRGQIVTARQIIGRAGCTGSCSGTHLHFQAWRRGTLIDPLDLLGQNAFRGI